MKRIFPFLLIVLLLSTCNAAAVKSSVITIYPVPGDDTAVIQAAFDKLVDGLGNKNPAYVRFEPGVYQVTGTLDLKNKYRAIIDGQTAVLQGDFTLNASGSYITIRDLNLQSDADIPAFIFGRNADGSGGWMVLNNVDVHSNNDIAAVLFGQADLSQIVDSEIYNGGNAPALILTSENETGLLDYPASTETLVTIRDSWIHGNGDVLVSMRGLVQNVQFDTVFFSPNGAAVELTNGQAHDISFPNSRSEGAADAVLFRTLPGTIASVIDLTGYVHAMLNARYILDVRGTLDYLIAPPFISRSNSVTELATVSGALSMMDDYGKQPDVRIVDNYFSYSAPVLKLQNANLTHLAPLGEYETVTVIFDGNSTIGGGYFIGLPQDPYTGAAGEVMELISLSPWYWTVIQ